MGEMKMMDCLAQTRGNKCLCLNNNGDAYWVSVRNLAHAESRRPALFLGTSYMRSNVRSAQRRRS